MSTTTTETSRPTGKTYRFSTFQELVDRVPADRIRVCMSELGAILGTAKATTELTYATACHLAKKEPLVLESVITLPAEFEWMDDGKEELTATMMNPEGERLFGVNITNDTTNERSP